MYVIRFYLSFASFAHFFKIAVPSSSVVGSLNEPSGQNGGLLNIFPALSVEKGKIIILLEYVL